MLTDATDDYRRALKRAVRYLCNGADAVCDDMARDDMARDDMARDGLALSRGVPRLNAMTGGYSFDNDYVWDSWADFQWAGFLAGRLWLLHLLTQNQRYADAPMQICQRIGPVIPKHPASFASHGLY